ncbi:hypothetical protein HETIRDRAFT_412221 [Heterobasidion irregulare TC 32-1]|uniref:Uncharacterized protein n=1 Tax=Heterobasidion irregulare (strain TC 32-1) TaxID=747525 RepID=W4JSQ9_HETIT|nr:uncharacterized protein HETIRDRAFT_412221 [Heterobasidion irregulare TC 32-1]ETW75896.1 hypothetical protein HETIRDRAFT_412221 [Heterobasidion irregulare TC 32-1]
MCNSSHRTNGDRFKSSGMPVPRELRSPIVNDSPVNAGQAAHQIHISRSSKAQQL